MNLPDKDQTTARPASIFVATALIALGASGIAPATCSPSHHAATAKLAAKVYLRHRALV